MSELTLEQMKANRKAWVEALRSGAHKQAKGELLGPSGGYCCLGVACIVAGKSNDDIKYEANLGNLPDVRRFFGLREADGDFFGGSLVWLNDDDRKSFPEIADVIESEPEGLFVRARDAKGRFVGGYRRQS